MNIVALRVLVAVAEHGSMTAAADIVGYARSSASEQLRNLERDIGVPLLMPGTPIRLTPAGRTLLPHARVILLATAEGMAAARARHQEDGPSVRLVGRQPQRGPVLVVAPTSGAVDRPIHAPSGAEPQASVAHRRRSIY